MVQYEELLKYVTGGIMSFYSVGLRRSRAGKVLDVTYPVILSDEKTLAELKKLLNIKEEGS